MADTDKGSVKDRERKLQTLLALTNSFSGKRFSLLAAIARVFKDNCFSTKQQKSYKAYQPKKTSIGAYMKSFFVDSPQTKKIKKQMEFRDSRRAERDERADSNEYDTDYDASSLYGDSRR